MTKTTLLFALSLAASALSASALDTAVVRVKTIDGKVSEKTVALEKQKEARILRTAKRLS